MRRRLEASDAFPAQLTRLVASEVRLGGHPDAAASWRNVGDLLFGLLASPRPGALIVPSSAALAARAGHRPWLRMLRGYLRQAFTMGVGGQEVTVDSSLRFDEGDGRVLEIRSTRPPTEAWETELPDPPPAPGPRGSRAVPSAWMELQAWLARQPLFFHPVWKLLTGEWALRQDRYRRVFSAYCVPACRSCPQGGCCRARFPGILDVAAHLIHHGALPPVGAPPDSDCPFLGAGGCSLLPGPVPSICCLFHCRAVIDRAPPAARRMLPLLAEDADRAWQPCRALWTQLLPPPPAGAAGWETRLDATLDPLDPEGQGSSEPVVSAVRRTRS